MGRSVNVFKKTVTSEWETDAFHDSEFQVFYSGEQPIVEFIELSRGSTFRAIVDNLDVFATPALAVVAHLARKSPFDAADPEIPYAYLFREWQLSLWRPVVPETDADEDGRYFSTIGIGRVGYYDVA